MAMEIDIGQNIKMARIAAGLTQEELAKKCGLATITIRQYESGRRSLNIKQLAHVACAIGVDWADLVPDPEPDEIEETLRDYYDSEEYIEKAILHLLKKSYPSDEEFYKAFAENKVRGIALLDDAKSKRLISAYGHLNNEGRQKAIERVEELTEIPRYRRQEPAEAPPASPVDTDTPTEQDAPEGAGEGE